MNQLRSTLYTLRITLRRATFVLEHLAGYGSMTQSGIIAAVIAAFDIQTVDPHRRSIADRRESPRRCRGLLRTLSTVPTLAYTMVPVGTI